MAASSFAFLSPGTRFHGRYDVVRGIKAGAMGAVHEVLDIRTDAARALKVMLASIVEDPDLRERFEREARVTGGIESDHIVKVFDAGVDATTGMPFLVMELLRGEDLGAPVRRGERIAPHEIVTYLAQVARALDKTHAAGIVHRDLKPDNLFLARRDDGSPSVKILDFGIAKVIVEGAAGASRQLGTPLYMSPEQMGGIPIDGRADLYALGHITYTLLVGEAYWKQEARASEATVALFDTMRAGPTEPPVARAARRRGVALPPAFDRWFARAAAADPSRRYPTAFEQATALAEVLGVATPRAHTGEVSGPSGVVAVAATRPVDPATAAMTLVDARRTRAGHVARRRLALAGLGALAVAAVAVPFVVLERGGERALGAEGAATVGAPSSAVGPAPASAASIEQVPALPDGAAASASAAPRAEGSAAAPPRPTAGGTRGASRPPPRRQMF